jgi:hypothetical protein
MYSPYSAILKEQYWGGIPISLFALGAFAFLTGFALYLLLSGPRAPRSTVVFFAVVSLTPLVVSAVMFTISVTKVGALCKTCVGIYAASFLLAAGGVFGLTTAPRFEARGAPLAAALPLAWLVLLALTTLVPAVVYASAVPDHRAYLTQCGELKQPVEKHDALVKLRTPSSIQPATLFEDPLCPTCQAFHDRLVGEDVFDKLDVRLVLFPLDSECNWMLDAPLHPGACIVSKAVLCGADRAREVLEWAYDEQVYLTRAGKAGPGVLKEVIRRRWGESLTACLDQRETELRLNQHLHFASDNSIPVSTPQAYLGKRRICDEDTDIGLRYTLAELAPEVLR